MHLAGLGVDEIGGERSRISPKERVRERAVAPEETAEVQADEQLRPGVEQAAAQVGNAAACEERSERQRVVEMSGDQDGFEIVTPFGTTPTASTTGISSAARLRSSPYSRRAIGAGSSLSA